MITWENYEEYLMMRADGELHPDEEQELLAFIQQHPELRKEMDAYELTRLTPDTTEVFADKNSLLKPNTQNRIIAFPQWIKYSIAAGLALFISVAIFRKVLHTNQGNEIVRKDSIKTKSDSGYTPQVAVKEIPGTKNNAGPDDSATKEQKTMGSTQKLASVIKINIHKPGTKVNVSNTQNYASVIKINIHKPGSKSGTEQTPATKTNSISDRTEMSELPVASTKQIPVNMREVPVPSISNVPADKLPAPSLPDVVAVAQTTKRHTTLQKLWNKVPLDERNKKQFENIAGAVASAYEGVTNTGQNIAEKSLNLKIQNSQFILSIN